MSQRENNTSVWIETPLSKFGFKCIMNEHGICVDSSCECLCHHGTFESRTDVFWCTNSSNSTCCILCRN